jgi:hypothetical protein
VDPFTSIAAALGLLVFGALAGVIGHEAWLRLFGHAVVRLDELERLRQIEVDAYLPAGVSVEEELFTDADGTAVVYRGRLAAADAIIVEMEADGIVGAFPLTRSRRDVLASRAKLWCWSDETGGWARALGSPVDALEKATRKGFFADLRARLREESDPHLSVVEKGDA